MREIFLKYHTSDNRDIKPKTKLKNEERLKRHRDFKSFAIIPSRSRRTMWAKYPKSKLVQDVSE